MLRSFERLFKRALGATLRFIVGSRRHAAPLPDSFKRILVIRQHNQLGDMLCAVPLLRALRSRFPSAQLTLMASPVNYDVMDNLRYVNQVLRFDKREYTKAGPRGFRRLLGFIKDLRRSRFDLVLVPSTVSTSFTSDMMAFLTGAPLRIGVGSVDRKENPSGFFFNLPIHTQWAASPHKHQTLRNLEVGVPLGLMCDDLTLEITLREAEVVEAKSWLNSRIRGHAMAIALHPGAGKVPNRWPTERFARVAEALSGEFDAGIFVTCGPMDRNVVDMLIRIVSVPVEVVENQHIRRVASCLRQMDLLISNDTGIMHVGAAVGTPVLSLFGPTDPEQWAPIGGRNRYIAGRGDRIDTIAIEEVLESARSMLHEALRNSPAGHGRPC